MCKSDERFLKESGENTKHSITEIKCALLNTTLYSLINARSLILSRRQFDASEEEDDDDEDNNNNNNAKASQEMMMGKEDDCFSAKAAAVVSLSSSL